MAKTRGIDNVIEWYESLPNDVWSQWEAFDRVEPIGCEWERHASLMAMIETLYAATINPNLDQKDRIKPRQPVEFLPIGFAKTDKKPKVSLRQQLSLLAKAFGGKYGDNDK